MSEWRSFGASNKKDTCLWCGKKLRHLPKIVENPAYAPAAADRAKSGDLSVETLIALPKPYLKIGVVEKGGAYEDGFFCGLRCGFEFAVTAATNNFRLQRRQGPK